jgi:hypothetical protein
VKPVPEDKIKIIYQNELKNIPETEENNSQYGVGYIY